MIFFWLFLLLVAVFLVLWLVAYIFSGTLLTSQRQPVTRTPQDYGMAFEKIEFLSSDGLQLKGWWIPAKGVADKAIIMTHPFPFNRHGFLSKNQGFPPLCFIDVDLLTTARALHNAGYPVLMFDFRNHGESASGITGVGLNEYQDVLGAVSFIESRSQQRPIRIGFVSFCMGANATIVALSKGVERVSNIVCLVAIQPVSAAVFVRQYLRAQYTPLSVFLAGMVDAMVQWRGGYALAAMSPIGYAKDIKVPAFFIQAPADRWTTVADTQAIVDATPGEKEIWWVDGITRRFDTYNFIGEHPERILAFLKKYIG
jgi:uncharacterized protein